MAFDGGVLDGESEKDGFAWLCTMINGLLDMAYSVWYLKMIFAGDHGIS